MKGLIVFLAVCTFTAAMVAPIEKRAVNTEEEEGRLRILSKPTQKPSVEICAPQTPCAWSIYKPISRIIEMNITNTYCTCGLDKSCEITEDDSTVNAYVLRCRPSEEGAAQS